MNHSQLTSEMVLDTKPTTSRMKEASLQQPRFQRVLLPIERDSSGLGSAVIGQRTVRQAILDRSIIRRRMQNQKPTKMLDQLDQVTFNLQKFEQQKDPKSLEWSRTKRNLLKPLQTHTSVHCRLSSQGREQQYM